ncbi:hypothetical protein H2200_006647 [Cladophialophora chaetospira]|uniref:Uncharacterized protein n=1 Tax=Cladophialophora chaetospira TaxID=386627 RepID=A0AA39CI47_9EURO|nr:hypothetical protein H2200_006647 [Cladophialophora chaetospira]
MYAGPSKRIASKAICPSCRLLAAFRPLSTSPVLRVKKRTPRNVREVRPDVPGSMAQTLELAKSSVKSRDEKPHYISPELAAGLQQLGFHSIPAVVNVLRELSAKAASLPPASAFSAISTQQRFIEMMEVALGSAEAALMRDPKVLRKAFHLLAQNYFHLRNSLGLKGFEILRMIFLAGELEAGIDAFAAILLLEKQAERTGKAAPDSTYFLRIGDFIKAKALARTDWRAVTMYLKEMTRFQGTKAFKRECYQLAKEFYSTVEPSRKSRVENPWLLQDYELPWKTFYEAARIYLLDLPEGKERDNVQADMELALRDGLYKYTDPRAVAPALRNDKVIPRHSKEWIQFATEAATKGEKDASFELAKYHLSKDGWYPKTEGKKPTKWTGIEWLGVSAALSSPDTTRMVYLYCGLAHVLRERGYLAEGRSWLSYARENIGEAGLDMSGAEKLIIDIEEVWKRTDSGDQAWERYVKTSEYYFTELDRVTPP